MKTIPKKHYTPECFWGMETSMLVGYARASTTDQSPNLQIDALTQAGCESIYKEKLSGGERNGSFDLIRVVMCFLVVAWHTKILGPSSAMLSPTQYPPPLSLVDIVYFNGFLLAVPTFLTLSNWLLYERLVGPEGMSYLRRRLIWLGSLYLFWSFLHLLYMHAPLGCGTVPWVSCILQRLLTGNGAWAIYYLVAQMFADVTLAALVASRPALRRILMLLLCVVFLSVELAALAGKDYGLGLFWSPLSFAAIPPAIVFVRRWNTMFATGKGLAGIAIMAAITMLLEWMFFDSAGGNWASFPAYCRVSEVLAALTIVLSAVRWRVQISPLLRHLSDKTLGIYVVHYYFIIALDAWIKQSHAVVVAAIVLIASYFSVLVAQPVLRQRLL